MPFIKLVAYKDVYKNFYFGGILMFKKLNKALLFIAFALSLIKAQDVSIAVGDTAFAGYTDDIVVPITLSNPENMVGGLQFDLIAMPTIVTLSGATPVDQRSFSADYTVFNEGSGRLVFYHGVGGAIAPGGNDVVLNLHYDGSEILSAIVQLEAYDLSVSDGDGDLINSILINLSLIHI